MKIYVTYTKESFPKSRIDELSKFGDLIFIEDLFEKDKAPYFNDESEKILAIDPDWYDWNFDQNHMKKIPNLKAIFLSTTAYDWIDLNYCKNNNIVVANIPKYSTDSVAEYAIFLMMCLAKKFPLQSKNNFKMEYSQSMLTSEIKNKTAGIIGYGTIGSRIAELCSGLGMNVIYWNRTEKSNDYRKVDLETIFKTADYIIPAFSTNNETNKIITDDLINMMNNNSFINVVNNPIEIYNHDLMLAKAEKEIISYAFEIYGEGKKINDYKGNIMVTAPYAFYTKEAVDRLVDIWCDNIISYIKKEFQNII